MKKISFDQSWSRAEQYFLVASSAMPNVTLKVWRTDGLNCAPSEHDLREIANLKFPLRETVHLRNCYRNFNTTFDVAAEILPSIPEVPKEVLALCGEQETAKPA